MKQYPNELQISFHDGKRFFITCMSWKQHAWKERSESLQLEILSPISYNKIEFSLFIYLYGSDVDKKFDPYIALLLFSFHM